ncbi:hypothetical protein [Moraxella sp.]|nr:hypothetical protein [Moraxella sp.]MDO4895701.1 hypothetical protein [Moraxella sp.]
MSERKVPKLRFAGFTDDWKQRKLGEVLLVRNEFAEQHYFKIDIELENLEPETGRLIGDLSIRTKTNSIFKKGDILFGRLRPYLKKWHLAQTNGLKSGEIWAFYSTDEFCRNFIYLLVQTENFLKIANISAGTKMPRAD